MKSSLSQQLTKLKIEQRAEPNLPKESQATLLFDYRKARQIDIETIYSLGMEGLLKLKYLNLRNYDKLIKLNYYEEKLFGHQARYFNRETKLASDLSTLDNDLHEFICFMSQYFYNENFHKVLEFLIKIYSVNVYNSNFLLFTFLPFHESNIFLKLLQNIDLQKFANFKFLNENTKQAKIISKEQLFKEFSRNYSMLLEVYNFFESNYNRLNDGLFYYFNFIGQIFKFIINKSKVMDQNILNLIIRFISIYFENFEKFNNDDQQIETLKSICELIITINLKYEFKIDYKNAFVNGFFNNVLKKLTIQNIHMNDGEDYSQQVSNYVIKTILSIFDTNLKLNLEESDLKDEDFATLILNSIESISKEYDIGGIVFALLKNVNGKNQICFVEKVLRNCFLTKKSKEKVIEFTLSQYHMDIYRGLSEFLEKIYTDEFYEFLIKITKNNMKIENKDAVISHFLKNKHGNVDFYQLFIDLNSTNSTILINALDLLDNLITEDKSSKLIKDLLSSLINTIYFNQDEVVINKILQMKNFNYLLEGFENFRNSICDLIKEIILSKVKFTDYIKSILYSSLIPIILERNYNSNITLLCMIINDNALNNVMEKLNYNSEHLIKLAGFSLDDVLSKLISMFENGSIFSLYDENKLKSLIEMSVNQFSGGKLLKVLNLINISKLSSEEIIDSIINKVSNNEDYFEELITKIVEINEKYILRISETKFNNNTQQLISLLLLRKSFNIGIIKYINNYDQMSFNLFLALVLNLQNQKKEESKLILDTLNKFRNDILNIEYLPLSLERINSLTSNVKISEIKSIIEIIECHKNEILLNSSYFSNFIKSNKNQLFPSSFLSTTLLAMLIDNKNVNLLTRIMAIYQTTVGNLESITNIASLFDSCLDYFKNNNLANEDSKIEFVQNVINLLLNSNKEQFVLKSLSFLLNTPKTFIFKKDFIERFVIQSMKILTQKSTEQTLEFLELSSLYSLDPTLFNLNIDFIEVIKYINRTPSFKHKLNVVSYVIEVFYFKHNFYFDFESIYESILLLKNFNLNLSFSNNLLTLIRHSNKGGESKYKESISILEEVVMTMFNSIIKESNIEQIFLNLQIVNNYLQCLSYLYLNNDSRNNFKALISNLLQTIKDYILLIHINIRHEIQTVLLINILNFIRFSLTVGYTIEGTNTYINFFIKSCFNFLDENPKLLLNYLKNLFELIKFNDSLITSFVLNIYYYFNLKESDTLNHVIYYLYDFFRNKETLIKNFQIILDVLSNLKKEAAPLILDNNNNYVGINLNFINFIIDGLEANTSTLKLANQSEYENIVNDVITELFHIKEDLKLNNKITDSYSGFNINLVEIIESKFFLLLETTHMIHHLFDISFDKISNLEVAKYFFEKYFNLLCLNTSTQIQNNHQLINVFSIFANNLAKLNESNLLQLATSILTKIMFNNKKLSDIIKETNLIKTLLSKMQEEENNYTKHSILVMLSKVYLTFNKSFMSQFNSFLIHLNDLFDTQKECLSYNVKILCLLTKQYGSLFSPILESLVFKLISLKESKYTKKIEEILLNLSSTQLFDFSFDMIKSNYKKTIESNEDLDSKLRFLFFYLQNAFKVSDKLVIADLNLSIVKFFMKTLQNQEKYSTNTKDFILESFSRFVLRINENILKDIFSFIYKFCIQNQNKDSVFKYDLQNVIIMYQLFKTILNTIKHIFVPYFEKYKDNAIELYITLNNLLSVKQASNKKKERSFFEDGYQENKPFSYITLNSLLLDNLRLNFKFNKNNQILNNTIEELFEPLTNQLKISYYSDSFLFNYYEEHIKPTFTQVFEGLSDEDRFKELNDMILNLVKENSPLTKILTLRTVYNLYESLKERYIPQTQEVIPYVTECLEDRNEKVQQEAFKLIKLIEKNTGEDFKNYLD